NLILALCVFTSFSAFSQIHKPIWKKLNYTQKIKTLEALKTFLKSDARDTELEEVKASAFKLFFIHKAYAAEFEGNCFYAGWPSKLVTVGERKVCTSPQNVNPIYKKEAARCGQGALLCNPLLFGSALCISNKTKEERQSSFSNCQKAFESEGRSLEKVIKEIDADPELQKRLSDLFDLLANACSPTGYQGKSGMCALLKSRLENLKKNQAGESTQADVLKPDATVIGVVNQLDVVTNTVTKLNTPNTNRLCYDSIPIPDADKVQGPWEMSGPMDLSASTPKDYCFGNENGTTKEKYMTTKYADYDNGADLQVTFVREKGSEEMGRVDGFELSANRYGKSLPYIEEGETYPEDEMIPHRDYGYDMDARNKEAMFTLLDWPVKEIYAPNGKVIERYRSTDVRMTNYMFFPRKVIPSVSRRQDKIFMTLVTGEKVVFDAKSGKVVDGAFIEKEKVNVETRPKEKRFYPNASFNYRGEGMWLEAPITNDKDYRKPGSLVPIKSIVNGVESKCNMPSESLFEYNWGYRLPQGSEGWLNSGWSCFKFKFEDDESFYKAVKAKCPAFKMPPLTSSANQ
ncbi:MAG: hypothetical protein K2P81_08635, partial [Bacteriovoracaceae bacterium]|nr:hypothetical protein [Bacteriovoracaceae bacterium]